jgi:hypothetical protein
VKVCTCARLAQDKFQSRDAEIVRLQAQNAELLAALERCVYAGTLIQNGERNGYVMGAISNATDEARAVTARAKGDA